MEFIRFLLIGLVAGWIVGRVGRGQSYGLIGNLFVGVMGSLVGGYLFGFLGMVAPGTLGSILTAVVGAVIFLWLLSFFRPSRKVKKKSSDDE